MAEIPRKHFCNRKTANRAYSVTTKKLVSGVFLQKIVNVTVLKNISKFKALLDIRSYIQECKCPDRPMTAVDTDYIKTGENGACRMMRVARSTNILPKCLV